jgi:hypothetical protein
VVYLVPLASRVCRPVRRTGGCAPPEGIKGEPRRFLPSHFSDAVLGPKETTFGLRSGGLASNGETSEMILFSLSVGVKDNRNFFCAKRARNVRFLNGLYPHHDSSTREFV